MPAIKKPNQHFDVSLYTGNGSSVSVTNSGSMQPDFVWIKARSTAQSHSLYDAVRGATKQLNTNNTGAEGTYAGVSSFNSDGYTIGTADNNTNGATYVGWQWKAGGAAVTNTTGSISAQVSANPTAGFSVVTFTAQASGSGTIGHGLGVTPAFVIVKTRATAGIGWATWNKTWNGNQFIQLNTTDAVSSLSTIWNGTTPTSTVFSLGSAYAGLGTMVAYCWAEVAGYSAFGSYTGNGSTDGTFVYTGFRPRFIVIKSTGVEDWRMFDTSRSTYNIQGATLYPNASSVENAGQLIDINSNGFKCRTTDGAVNGSGTSYIYAAFAEAPFKFSNGR